MVDITKSQDWSTLSIPELEQAVEYHNRMYWVENAAVISDPDFDRLVEALRSKAPSSPILDAIGPAGAGAPEFDGVKVTHDPPMLSLDKCYDEATLLKWFDKFEGDAVVSPKIDGVAVCIRYDSAGRLALASTRGNGVQGELITENVRRIVNVPESVPEGPIELRGEAYMPWSVFRRKFEKDYSSPRNLTAGALKLKDPSQTANYEIHFFGYDVIGRTFSSEVEKAEFMRSVGFTPADSRLVVHADLQQTFEEFVELRASLDYDTDGVVYKANSIEEQQRMGITAHHPRFALAYKFQGDSGQSVLRDVEWSVSRTGAINPVGVVDPVELSGATVTRASLHNLAIMAALGGPDGLKLGSTVEMVRRGGVIPHLERVISPGATPVEIPSECPACGAPTTRVGDVLMAEHTPACSGAQLKQLQHFTQVMEIKGFGPKIMEALYDAGLVQTVDNLYELTPEQLTDLDRMGRTLAEKLVAQIDESRRVPARVFLRALGIEELGNHVSKILEADYSSLDEVRAIETDELAAKHTIGEIIAEKVTSGLRANAPLIDRLIQHVDVVFEAPAPVAAGGALSGKSFLFTGALDSMSRKEAQQKVEALGGTAPSGVSKDLDYLVLGDADLARFEGGWRSSKLKKAESYNDKGSNIAIIGETAFLALIGDVE